MIFVNCGTQHPQVKKLSAKKRRIEGATLHNSSNNPLEQIDLIPLS